MGGFQKRGLSPTSDYSDTDSTTGWSSKCTDTMSSDILSPIRRLSSKICIEETKSETSVMSRSPISCTKVLKAKHCVTEINQEKLIINAMFNRENAANIKLSEIDAIDESQSLQVRGEPTTQLVMDEQDSTFSDYISCAFVARENNKHKQKGRSLISDDITHEPEQTSLKRSRRNSKRNTNKLKVIA